MCWSAQVSLNTFALAVFGMLLARANNYSFHAKWTIWTYLSLFSFACMQLVEAVMWMFIGDGTINAIMSAVAMTIIVSQPMFSIAAIDGRRVLRSRLMWAYVAFVGVCALVLAGARYPIPLRSSRVANGHLKWEWLAPFLGPLCGIAVVWTVFLLVPQFLNGSYVMAVVLSGTFAVSLFTYWTAGTAGSMWCWILNLIWFGIIFDVFRKTMCM